MVSVILDNFAGGTPREEILASYPSLASDDIEASLAYAVELARERVVPISPRGRLMRFKIDENLPAESIAICRDARHSALRIQAQWIGTRDIVLSWALEGGDAAQSPHALLGFGLPNYEWLRAFGEVQLTRARRWPPDSSWRHSVGMKSKEYEGVR